MVVVLAGLFMHGCPTLLSPSICYVMLDQYSSCLSLILLFIYKCRTSTSTVLSVIFRQFIFGEGGQGGTLEC